jgi:hypothetical protein
VNELPKNIELHHVGEVLVNQFLSELTVDDFIAFLKSEAISIDKKTKDIIIKRIEKNIGKNGKIRSKTERPFLIKDKKTGNKINYDSYGRVDICIFNYSPLRENDIKNYCLPIEVKMGLTGQAKNWNSLNNLNSAISFQAEDQKKIKGSVSSLLGRKYLNQTSDESKIDIIIEVLDIGTNKPRKECLSYTYDSWLICGRKTFKRSFFSKNKNAKYEVNYPLWFAIEDLANWKNVKTKKKDIVLEIIEKAKINFFKSLGIKEKDAKNNS